MTLATTLPVQTVMTGPDMVGLLGVGCILAAYFLLQAEVFKADAWGYLGLNLAGAMLLIFSLLHAVNLASFVIEICWLAISIFGISRRLMRGRRA